MPSVEVEDMLAVLSFRCWRAGARGNRVCSYDSRLGASKSCLCTLWSWLYLGYDLATTWRRLSHGDGDAVLSSQHLFSCLRILVVSESDIL